METWSPSSPWLQGGKLTGSELERYDRQLRITGFGTKAQLRLKGSTALVVGAGGLGSAACLYLAAGGVGRLKIVDFEKVELSNLNRQVLYTTRDIGKPKVEAASRRLLELNPEIAVEPIQEEVSEENLPGLLEGVDVVLDCLDNFRSRFLLNRACIKRFKPLIHGAVYGMEGRLMTIIPGDGPCLRCLIPSNPKEREMVPVLGSLPGIVGALEALEAIKLLTGLGELAVGRLLIIDGRDLSFYSIEVKRNPECPICGKIRWGEEG